jgi:hypothetical protein
LIISSRGPKRLFSTTAAWSVSVGSSVVLQGQRLQQRPLDLPAEGVFQSVARTHRPVQILGVGRRLGEAGVVVGEERQKEAVAGLQGADAGQAHLLDQPATRYRNLSSK